ncbi:hypothetical protein EOQ07_15040 [Escherichia coli]|nr:hypothetical protein [Escherichia coli]
MTTVNNKKCYPSEKYLNELITNIEFAARAPVEVVRAIAAVHNAGGNSWALLGSTFSAGLRRQLAMLPYDFRVIGDNDAAGESLVKSFGKGFVAPDLDELQPNEVSHLIFSHSQ